ncbi:MAG: hypothetical protein ABID54_10420 [Pseudomonadota bacterium]
MKKYPHIKLGWKDYHTITFFHDLEKINFQMHRLLEDMHYGYIHEGLIDVDEFEKVLDRINEWASITSSKGGDTGRNHFIIDVK